MAIWGYARDFEPLTVNEAAMWSDNETKDDFLNFRCVADTAAEVIIQAGNRPLSMGVSGGWGVGKSSMLNLIEAALEERSDDSFVFVRFNAMAVSRLR